MNEFYFGEGFSSYRYSPDYFLRKKDEKRVLRRIGLLCGAALLGYIAVQQLVLLIVQLLGFWDEYSSNTFFQSAVDIILTFLSVLLPFYLSGRRMKKLSGEREPLSFERKVGIGSSFLAIVAGAGLCMAASIVSTYFLVFASLFGFELSSPDVPMPQGISGIIMSVFRVVITAAMAEEIALRGYVLGNLKKYGDSFAIGMSSVVFAIMHGNLVQAPFALLAGFAIGYFTVKTGSLWTGIIIHGMNNLISVFISYLMDYAGEEFTTLVYAVIVYGIIFVGIFCLGIFILRTKNRRLEKSRSVLSFREKLSAFILNPTMLIALTIMMLITATYVNSGGK